MSRAAKCATCDGKRMANPRGILGTETCPACAGTGRAGVDLTLKGAAGIIADLLSTNVSEARQKRIEARNWLMAYTNATAAAPEALCAACGHFKRRHYHAGRGSCRACIENNQRCGQFVAE